MGFSVSSTSIQVTISGAVSSTPSIPTPSATQNLIVVNRLNGTGALQTIFTTTAGKTAYVMWINAYGTAATSANIMDNAGTNIFSLGLTGANANTFISNGGSPILKVAAGEKLQANHANTVYVSVGYIEV